MAPLMADAFAQLAAGLERLAEAERNLVVQQAQLDDRLLRVEHNRAFAAIHWMVRAGSDLILRAKSALPWRTEQNLDHSADYAKWVTHEAAGQPCREEARAVSERWAYRPRISLLLADSDGGNARGWLESLREQAYENWELCVVVDRVHEARISDLKGQFQYSATEFQGDAEGWNAAANLATGEYLAFVEGAGRLAPLALHYFAEALQRGPADVLYSDEDAVDAAGQRVRPVFKPDWSPDLLWSRLYPGHLLAVARELFLKAGGLERKDSLADLMGRLAAGPLRVHHIPRVLYHGTPAAAGIGEPAAKQPTGPAAEEMTAIICSRSPEMLETCLTSLRATAGKVVRQIVVVAHEESGQNPELRAVIERAGATVVSYRGAFDFARMSNRGATAAERPLLLFLNDDIRATQAGWAEILAAQASRKAVGAAGAVLWYPSGVLQHAGIVVGAGDGVGHTGRHQRSSELWPWLLCTRDVSAVTGACLAMRREVFQELGGFDPLFPNNYNDVDLCFRARALGYRVVCVSAQGLIHSECRSRQGIVRFEERFRFYERWADVLRCPDPYYSPSLTPSEQIALNVSGDPWYRPLFQRKD